MQAIAVVGAVVLVILVFLLFVLVGAAISTAIVALVWNVLDVHSLFGAGTLSFWQCVGVGLALSILTRSSRVTVNGS